MELPVYLSAKKCKLDQELYCRQPQLVFPWCSGPPSPGSYKGPLNWGWAADARPISVIQLCPPVGTFCFWVRRQTPAAGDKFAGEVRVLSLPAAFLGGAERSENPILLPPQADNRPLPLPGDGRRWLCPGVPVPDLLEQSVVPDQWRFLGTNGCRSENQALGQRSLNLRMLLKLNGFYRDPWVRLGLSPSLLPHVLGSPAAGCPQRAVSSVLRDTPSSRKGWHRAAARTAGRG